MVISIYRMENNYIIKKYLYLNMIYLKHELINVYIVNFYENMINAFLFSIYTIYNAYFRQKYRYIPCRKGF